MSDIIKIEHLNKCFGDVKAVNDLSFRVKKGELFAFLGVNGAGKSTLFGLLTDTVRRDSGEILWDGVDILKLGREYRARSAICPKFKVITLR